MAIHEGWCIEAVCDRCKCVRYYPFAAELGSAELLRRKGWRVEAERDLCPMCKERAERAQEAAQTRGRRKRWRRR